MLQLLLIKNLENKPYICLVLLANLADILTPVDTRAIILVILTSFYPRDMESHWARWMIIELFVLGYIWCASKSLRNFTFDYFRDWHSLADQTSWCNSWHMSTSFAGIFLKIWSGPSILEVNILWCTTFWVLMHKFCTIWGYYVFPNEWNCGRFVTKTTWSWVNIWPVAGFRTTATDSAWNGEYPR